LGPRTGRLDGHFDECAQKRDALQRNTATTNLKITPSACPTGLGWDLLADATSAVVKSGVCTATTATSLAAGTYRLQVHLGSGAPGTYALTAVTS
jgi:hypothetical protein